MIRSRNTRGDEGAVTVGEPRRRTVRKRDNDPHPLGRPGSRHPDLNFDDNAPPSLAPVAKSSPREDAPPAPAPKAPVTTTATKPPAPIFDPDALRAAVGKARPAPTAKAEVPEVLTWDAVRTGTLPEDGSGIPESLERDVPPEFRFWKCENQEDALLVREALVEAELFTPDTIRVVNGEVRRVTLEPVVKMFLAPAYDDTAPVVVPARKRAIEKAAALLSDSETTTALFDEDVTEALGVETILEKVRRLKGDWVIAARDTAEVRKVLAPAFRLRGRADLLFATSADLADPGSVEWVTHDRADALVKFATERDIRLLKAAAPAEDQRIVMGVVLEPDEVDAQGDTISPEEIRNAAYKFMEDFQVSGIQHKEFAGGRVKIVESWIAPQDLTIEGQAIKAGTWMMTNRILDDALWKAAKEGKFTGFSIGGSAIRKPVSS